MPIETINLLETKAMALMPSSSNVH